MRRYRLLRKNQESGPFTIEEIRQRQLFASDLIWVDGESRQWLFSSELDELKDIVSPAPEPEANGIRKPPSRKPADLALPVQDHTSVRHSALFRMEYTRYAEENVPAIDKAFLRHLPPLRERVQETARQKKNVWSRKIRRSHGFLNLLRLAMLFIALFTGAVVIQKLAEGLEGMERTYQTPTVAASFIPEQPHMNTSFRTIAARPASANVEKSLLKKPAAEAVKGQILIKGSEYKTGFFGGIEGLRLNVFNESPYFVEKVEIVVSYLDNDGRKVWTGNFSLQSLKPGHAASLAVPPSKKGSRVMYGITGIRSGQNRLYQKQA